MTKARDPRIEELPSRVASPSRLSARAERAFARAMLALPDFARRRIAGPPIERDGNVLDGQLQTLLRLLRLTKPMNEWPVAAARKLVDASSPILSPSPPALGSVRDVRLHAGGASLRARVYRPLGATDSIGALVYFHGGGWVVGSLDSYDAPCRVIAGETPCVVIAIDYRLAPEHPFPAAVDDAIAAFRAVVALAAELGVDPARIAVGGDSAGGCLAAVVARETRNDAIRPAFQLLVYPVTDATMSTASYRSCGEGFFLERATMAWFFSHYVPTGTRLEDPRLSPLHAVDHGGQPPAFLLTAGFDPLRDEGVAYAHALLAAGVAVEHRSYDSLIHGFFNMGGAVKAAREPLDDIVASLGAAIGAKRPV